MDEIRVYSTALDEDELAAVMARMPSGSANLYAYYPCQTGSGETLYDAENGGDGNLINASWHVVADPPPFDHAILGSAQTLSVNTSGSLEHDGDYTLEAWVCATNYTEMKSIFLKMKTGYFGGTQYQMSLNENSCVFGNCGHDNAPVAIGTEPVQWNRWTHLAVVVDYDEESDTTVQSIYQDGRQVASGQTGGRTPNVNEALHIGYFWPGFLNELRVWTIARTPEQIAEARMATIASPQTGLAACLNASDVSGGLVHDSSGNLNYGVLGAGAAVVPVDVKLPPGPLSLQSGSDDEAEYEGLLDISRKTVPELDELVAAYRQLQLEFDNYGRGMNPLGLAAGMVPFDISPTELDAGKTHFDQIYERAVTALANAEKAYRSACEAELNMRRQYNSIQELQLALDKSELSYHNELIELFGYPYDDDIGLGGSYPPGYNGPDLVNFRILELDQYAGTAPLIDDYTEYKLALYNFEFTSPEDTTQYADYAMTTNSVDTNAIYDIQGWSEYATNGYTVNLKLLRNGLQVKPEDWLGRRRADGKVQKALYDYLEAWYRMENAIDQYDHYVADTQRGFASVSAIVKRTDTLWGIAKDQSSTEVSFASAMDVMEVAIALKDLIASASKDVSLSEAAEIPWGIGGAAGISSPVELVVENFSAPAKTAVNLAWMAEKIGGNALKEIKWTAEKAQAILKTQLARQASDINYEHQIGLAGWNFETELLKQQEMVDEVFVAIAAKDAAMAEVERLVAEGERLVAERSVARARVGKNVQSARYADMAFRIFRDEMLTKYQSAFELAARYAGMAAAVYDYETALALDDPEASPGSEFIEEIVKARSLGLVQNGLPGAGGSSGDPGLADVLARMKANWDVLKTQMGFNNPETEITPFSLRHDLFRHLYDDDETDGDWEDHLLAAKVDDLYALPEFTRYCKPFSTATNKEPAIVLSFSTSVNVGENFFGQPLGAGDSAYDPSRGATKIRSVGMWFMGYDDTKLAAVPRAYLVPVGVDYQRSPTDVDQLRSFTVIDQAVPVPFPTGSSDINEPEWRPLTDSLSESLGEIRRFPAMRCYYENDWNKYVNNDGFIDPELMISNARLIGRSVWNTRWLLIIPGSLLLDDPATGIENFIDNVNDIRILFHTYSIPGR